MRGLIAACLVGVAAVACGGSHAVTRIVDGREIDGRYIEPEAYADFLQGVLAQSRGDLVEAQRAFRSAAERDGDEPEIWARYAEVRCAAQPGDREAEKAIDRALAIDPRSARAWQVRGACALGRGDAAASAKAAAEALARDARSFDARALLARALVQGGELERARGGLVALTAEHGERAAAWDALAVWAKAKGDSALAARAWVEVVRLAPERRAEAGAVALEMAGAGDSTSARAVAVAAVDAPSERGGRRVAPSVARLAVDRALVAKDGALARARATRGHLSLEEIAGRAWLVGADAIALETARLVLDADPKSTGARAIVALAAEKSGDRASLARAFDGAERGDALVSRATAYALSAQIARVAGADAARRVLEGLALEPADDEDSLVVPVAVELAAMGALHEEALSPNARVELAARRRESPAGMDARAALDPRHALVAAVLDEHPGDGARALARKLGGAVGRDPLVTFAVARLALAEGRVDIEPARILAVDPSHPLLLGVALDVAKKMGDSASAAPMRVRLTAVARTPAERALAKE